MIVREELGTAGAHEEINPSTVKGITTTLEKPTSGTYAGKCAVAAMITVEVAPVRFRIDGENATTTSGHKVNAGEDITIVGGENVINFTVCDISDASDVMVTIFY